MEGPAVKQFVTAASISWSMLTCEHFSGGRGRFPEDAGARLTMGRLRRRIRLICAGCCEEQSRMLLRRELPPSRDAGRPDPKTGRRIASARTLRSCPHRAVADAARDSRLKAVGRLAGQPRHCSVRNRPRLASPSFPALLALEALRPARRRRVRLPPARARPFGLS